MSAGDSLSMGGAGSPESAFFFDCEGNRLLGVLSVPPAPSSTGVLVVVGGPQYRAGSHRQFVDLARFLAARGIACMRFDARGMGDSEGAPPGFEAMDSDLRAAIDAFLAHCPAVSRVALWGLCDGASAICLYAARDPRVESVVLVNPWVRTDAGQARTQLRHYYGSRLLDAAFWRKLLSGGVDLGGSVRELLHMFRRLAGSGRADPVREGGNGFPDRMGRALARFRGRILLILSGDDLTAREFSDTFGSSPAWSSIVPRVARREMAGADHTFSARAYKEQVADVTASWIGGQ